MRIEVKTYTINFPNCSSRYAYIVLFGLETETKKPYKIRLNFSVLAENNNYDLQLGDGYVNVPMNFALLTNSIDLLRNEKPVFFNWVPKTKVAILSTNEEPIGEEEI